MENNEYVDKLVRTYIKMRDKKAELEAEHKEKVGKVEEGMNKIKAALLEFCKEHGVEGSKVESGRFHRTVRTNYFASDWEALHKLVVEHNVPDLLQRRIHNGNMAEFLKNHPELQPNGLNAISEYSITVTGRKK